MDSKTAPTTVAAQPRYTLRITPGQRKAIAFRLYDILGQDALTRGDIEDALECIDLLKHSLEGTQPYYFTGQLTLLA